MANATLSKDEILDAIGSMDSRKHPRALRMEYPHHVRTDALACTGDQNGSTGKVGDRDGRQVEHFR